MTSIGEALYLLADRELHAELVDYAGTVIDSFLAARPRIDTGEWTIRADEMIEDYRQLLMLETGEKLREVTVIYSHKKGYHAYLSPPPPLMAERK